MQQYAGLKYSDDRSDARWLAEMLRLGILPTGYIYPEAERPVRDLLRQRSFLVRQGTGQLLHTGNILCRNQGRKSSRQQIRQMTVAEAQQLFPDRERTLAVESSLRVIEVLEQQIASIEKQVLSRIKPEAGFQNLQTVYGIGPIDPRSRPLVGTGLIYLRTSWRNGSRSPREAAKASNARHTRSRDSESSISACARSRWASARSTRVASPAW
jgi:hypothetical protein